MQSRPENGDLPGAGDDAVLLAGVVGGDAAVFGRLYSQYARVVFTFCGRRSGDWAAAEDLTSVVFLEAWRTRIAITRR